MVRRLFSTALVATVSAIAACGGSVASSQSPEAPEPAASAEPAVDGAPASSACRTDKMAFTQEHGCMNDGSVELCIPKSDAALRARLEALGPAITFGSSSGRARCDVERQTLVFFATPRSDARVCSSDLALAPAAWAMLCVIASEPAVEKIVPTFLE